MSEHEKIQVAQWVLAANQAWSLKTTAPLPPDLERKLKQSASPDATKVEACVQRLGVRHRTKETAQPTKSKRRPYDLARDGSLRRGTQVWHKLHGRGRVLRSGVENSRQVVEVAFDKGRTAKLLVEWAGLEVLA